MARPPGPLRVAVVAPPYYEVPPISYGGTELVCALLVDGLVERGHDVTLVAAGPDHTRARFIQTFAEPQPEDSDDKAAVEVLHAARAATSLATLEVDLVHDHTLAGALTASARAVPTLVTVHGPVGGPGSQVDTYRTLGRWAGLVAISNGQRRDAPDLNWAGTVPNGIRVDDYPYREDKDDVALFLGRMGPEKGVELAVEAARLAGLELILAGSWTVREERTYFEKRVRPILGRGVEWVGEVGGSAKKELLAKAACLLFPARWHEPFGLVIVEAMACGTPVVALRAGSVPELVSEGKSGVLCDRPSELAAAIDAARRLDPTSCRAHAAQRFGADRMVAGYDALYRRTLAAAAGS
jgi:glycosyltransferase involved in cell wall biosynthesis